MITSPTHANFVKLDTLILPQPHTLILGVSGHREILERVGNIDQLDLIKSRLRSQLEYLTEKYSLENIDLHTPLARGADQLVNEVCEHFCRDANINFTQHVVLPFDKEQYITYEDEPYQDELKNKLDKAKNINIPDVCLQAHQDAIDSDKSEEEAKQLALRALGDYYAVKCDFMICLWDGVHNHATGGTADVIYHMRELDREKHKSKSELSCQGLLILTVAREKNKFPSHEPLTWLSILFPPTPKKRSISKYYHFLKSNRPWILTFLAFMTILSGMIGYKSSLCEDSLEAFIISVSHLMLGTLNFSNNLTPYNGWILASYTFGFFFFAISVKALLDHLIFANTRFWCFVHANISHDLICGLGWRGQALLENQGDDSIKTIAIDIQPDKSAHGVCSKCSTPLLTDDASQWEVLKKTGLNNTRQAFVCTGSDEVNMTVVHQIAKQYRPGGCRLRKLFSGLTFFRNFVTSPLSDRLVCTVALLSRKNFHALLHSLPQGHHIDLRLFHTETATARMFMRNNHLDRFTCSPNATGARVVIIGNCTMADVLMHQNITQGIFEQSSDTIDKKPISGKKLEILRLLRNAREEAENFVAEYPAYKVDKHASKETMIKLIAREKIWSDEQVLPDIIMHELPRSQRTFVDWTHEHLESPDWVLTVIIAQEDPSISSATAARIAPVLEGIRTENDCDVALWFLFNTPSESMRAAIEHTLDSSDGSQHLHIRAFSDFLGICNRSIATGDEADAIAQRVNAAYFGTKLYPTNDQATLLNRKKEIQDYWEKPSANKDSSRQSAEHCFTKQRITNRMMLGHALTESQVRDHLAPIEHRRWCADHLMQGYIALTNFPSSSQNAEVPYHRTVKETDLIKAWFSSAGAEKDKVKAKSKQELKHVDLVPFKDFEELFKDLKNNKDKDLAQAEKDKDSAIVNHLDDIMRTDEFENI